MSRTRAFLRPAAVFALGILASTGHVIADCGEPFSRSNLSELMSRDRGFTFLTGWNYPGSPVLRPGEHIIRLYIYENAAGRRIYLSKTERQEREASTDAPKRMDAPDGVMKLKYGLNLGIHMDRDQFGRPVVAKMVLMEFSSLQRRIGSEEEAKDFFEDFSLRLASSNLSFEEEGVFIATLNGKLRKYTLGNWRANYHR